mmetsp:Transcript_1125/g.1927  ORF Transcript_1125/g.1927 Transcript_1125/m.1927 type:complete len:730 (-) Transcript_1125:95-2284(-)|eukprot:CAMPEP_0197526872 /NCGR_PEP_ID=MMETSP1318-20131121/19543_1 /TAXON_ID=552666 /ORGANISM="Partenskyella glossopodia, Strain RCC365" /LENGTH=729 /DNA_ID=CAMNT_0043081233 /DNA_START=250 /DNA_END=2439 /DNA_ORIENTATION=-
MGSGTSAQSKVPFDYQRQLMEKKGRYSIKVTQDTKDGGSIRRSPLAIGGLIDRAVWEDGSSSCTIWGAFERGACCFPSNECFGTRGYVLNDAKDQSETKSDEPSYKMDPVLKKCPMRGDYRFVSYRDALALAAATGRGLREIGVECGDNIGIFSNNRLEWVLTALGAYSQSCRIVSLYATLGADAVEYISNHSEVKLVVVSTQNLDTLLKTAPQIKLLKKIVVLDYLELVGNVGDVITDDQHKQAKQLGIELLGFSSVLSQGKGSEKPLNPPKPDDLAFIMYTSGTTGKPKGVMVSHRMVTSVVGASKDRFNVTTGDRHISYLPLAHIFETVVQVVVLGSGGTIGFFQGNIKKLTDDFKALKPTILCGVPRVFTKVYQKVFGGLSAKGCLIRTLFLRSYEDQCRLLRLGRPRNGSNDRILGKVKAAVGLSECRVILTGAAPCPGYLMEFLKAVIGATVLQGYGMTETAAGLSVSTADDHTVGHTGPPLPCIEVKLMDVAEMNYSSKQTPETGEICVRGPCVFPGYYKNEAATKETIVDGWLHTGDIGRWNPSGTLSVIDRKKNIFKMAQGEYIAAEKIESAYGKSPMVGQIWVYGNSFQSFVLAVVVPNLDQVTKFLRENNLLSQDEGKDLIGSVSRSCADNYEQVKAAVLASLRNFQSTLKGFEKVRDIIVECKLDKEGNGFNVANDCLTPTFKLRRPNLLRKYREDLQKCYADNGEPAENWPTASKK